jgi:hypothetical protein
LKHEPSQDKGEEEAKMVVAKNQQHTARKKKRKKKKRDLVPSGAQVIYTHCFRVIKQTQITKRRLHMTILDQIVLREETTSKSDVILNTIALQETLQK